MELLLWIHGLFLISAAQASGAVWQAASPTPDQLCHHPGLSRTLFFLGRQIGTAERELLHLSGAPDGRVGRFGQPSPMASLEFDYRRRSEDAAVWAAVFNGLTLALSGVGRAAQAAGKGAIVERTEREARRVIDLIKAATESEARVAGLRELQSSVLRAKAELALIEDNLEKASEGVARAYSKYQQSVEGGAHFHSAWERWKQALEVYRAIERHRVSKVKSISYRSRQGQLEKFLTKAQEESKHSRELATAGLLDLLRARGETGAAARGGKLSLATNGSLLAKLAGVLGGAGIDRNRSVTATPELATIRFPEWASLEAAEERADHGKLAFSIPSHFARLPLPAETYEASVRGYFLRFADEYSRTMSEHARRVGEAREPLNRVLSALVTGPAQEKLAQVLRDEARSKTELWKRSRQEMVRVQWGLTRLCLALQRGTESGQKSPALVGQAASGE